MDDDTASPLEALCTEILTGLDPDLITYIAGILGDESEVVDTEAVEDMAETISGFLESAEYCDSSEESLEVAKGLLVKVGYGCDAGLDDTNSGSPDSGPDLEVAGITQKIAATTMKLEDAAAKPTTTTTTKKASKSSNKASRNARKPKKGKKSQTASERALAEALQLDEELLNARIAAVQSRTTMGSHKGALDAPSFTLPNPGGGTPLLEDAACTLVPGRKYGLIGRNGTGKSTLLRAFAARRVGEVPKNVTVHYVSQEVNLTAEQAKLTPVNIVVEADIERTMLLEELAVIDDAIENSAEGLDEVGSKRHGVVLERLQDMGSDSAVRRATSLLENLGFSPELRSRPLAQLSGGWRVRTMLAAAIFAKPDLLLLDEPTNHLSILAVLWLTRELSNQNPVWNERTVIIVSHDRHFMDEVCTDCLHISGASRQLSQTHGNYSKWAKQRKEQQILFAKEQASRQAEIDKLRDYAGHGFKYGGSSSQINKMGMKAKQADKLDEANKEHVVELASLQEDIELPINIHSGGEQDGFIVQLLKVGFGYPGSNLLFQNCEFGITSKSRIVLLGENGNGKTTLVKLMMGELTPVEGEVRRSPHARFAKVDQHHADQIDLSLTPLQFLQTQYPGDGSYDHLQKLRGHLASCGVTSGQGPTSGPAGGQKILDQQNTPASALSGGQRSRVAMASVSFAKPHVLILDEPTNNLDLESVAALAESVRSFKGAVVCVSHDQFFVQAVADEAWVVNGGAVERVESFEWYRNRQLRVLNKTSKTAY